MGQGSGMTWDGGRDRAGRLVVGPGRGDGVRMGGQGRRTGWDRDGAGGGVGDWTEWMV